MKYLFLFFMLLLTGRSISQPPAERALLWKIQAPGQKAPSYLYGTFHLLCPKDLVVDSAIKKAFVTTRQLYLEVDMSNSAAMAMEMIKFMKMSNNQHLSKLLSKADYDSVSHLFQAKTGMPLNLLGNTKPVLLIAMLYPSLMNCQPESWEQTFVKMSEGMHMKMGGLETAELQLSLLDSIPYKDQAESLKTALYKFDSMAVATKKMVELYKSKNLKQMQAEVAADKDMGAFASILLDKRNASWIPVMRAQMKKAPTFFAVGAGHLAGKNGVINLLRKSGYTVTAVK
ncbi:TraB/GumN family protein [Filimonas effusa]|uniref:TraB/GumN family protein n=1 Tax=Filimonas effusa TaxID=2508721 RepID=A0A4Q1D9V2_9BACT|nr:TraB/GumN family protein [Filimonas effusa]RXK86162.1 TraB/GumN family protein [Filimonas effusa]